MFIVALCDSGAIWIFPVPNLGFDCAVLISVALLGNHTIGTWPFTCAACDAQCLCFVNVYACPQVDFVGIILEVEASPGRCR